MEAQLQIHHIGYQDDKPQFKVVRVSDAKYTAPVTLTPPEKTIVPGRPNNNLQQDLRWYLEQFLELPLGAYLDTAERVQATLQEWGSACFDSLFQKQARDWFQDARRQGLENLTLKIASNDPRVLAWPWEALHDPEGGTLAHHCRIERQLSELHDPLPLPVNLPKDRINILLVIARPYGDKDVGFHALSRPLVELTKAQNSPVHIDVLRPPTFDQLRQTLRDKPGFYHIVHFDGHGGYGTPGHTSPHAFKGMQGMLVFENDHAEPANVDAGVLSQLMAEHRIPIMVLNACQSAKIDEQADDAFASVAAALLKAGIRSVVAMGYNLYVSGAQQFVPAFYQRLLNSGNVAEAARAGRQAMLAHPERVCVLGEHNLQDWLVPVLYQQLPPGEAVLPNIQRSAPAFVFPGQGETETPLPEAAQYLGDYGFIGRERAVQALERARLQQPQAAFLIHGMAGIGKTTLAKGFLHWLYDTNGLAQDLPNGGVFWFSFDEIRSAEYVINAMVDPMFGTNARAEPLQQKLEVLIKALREHPFLLVWDNFESASGIAGTEVTALLHEDDRQLLKDLLKRLRGGKTKVLLTSRSPENWLTPQECYHLPLSGLQGEELWEYCNAVVHDLGLKINRKQEDFQKLIEALDGNPLAIRAILLRLPERKAADLLVELKQQFAGQEGDESTRRIGAALSLFDQCLPETFAPILQLIGLHVWYVNQDYLQAMLEKVEDTAALPHTVDCFAALETAGLLHALGQNIYQMHPVLQGYLLNKHSASDAQKRIFVIFMAYVAEKVLLLPFHLQYNAAFLFEREFYHALKLAKQLLMREEYCLLASSWGQIKNITKSILRQRLYLILLLNIVKMEEKYLAVAYIRLAGISQDTFNYALTRHWCILALEVVKEYEFDLVKFEAYQRISAIELRDSNFKEAEDFCKLALKIAIKMDNKREISIIYHQLGTINEKQHKIDDAEHWYRKSIDDYEHIAFLGDQSIAHTYHNLGNISEKKNDYEKAKFWYKKSLTLKEEVGDHEGVASSYHHLGLIAERQENYEEAEIFYKKSLLIKEKISHKCEISNTYHHLGNIAQQQEDYETAQKWYEKALENSEECGDFHVLATTLGRFGIMKSKTQNHAEACQLLMDSIVVYYNANSPYHEWAMRNFIEVFLLTEQESQTIIRQRWHEAGLDQIITLDQLEQQLNDNP